MNIYSHQKINVSGTSHRDLSAKIRELDRASTIANFERAQISFFIGDRFGIELGRVRKPFGFWDDYYSLFRNLSALKTDPVSLGVALRRADQGVVAFGRAMGASYSTRQPMSACTTSVEIRREFLFKGRSKDRRNVLTQLRTGGARQGRLPSTRSDLLDSRSAPGACGNPTRSDLNWSAQQGPRATHSIRLGFSWTSSESTAADRPLS